MDDPTSLVPLVSSLPPELIVKVYEDLLAAPVRETSKIAVDIVKTLRFFFFSPFQNVAMHQDRLEARFHRASQQVPEERLVTPADELLFPIASQLRILSDGSKIADLYINLLACAMDRDRRDDAHPGFLNALAQLAGDEILILDWMRDHNYLAYFQQEADGVPVSYADAIELVERGQISAHQRTELLSDLFNANLLVSPNMFRMHFRHLVAIGLVEFTNKPKSPQGVFKETENKWPRKATLLLLQYSEFGSLLMRACTEQRI